MTGGGGGGGGGQQASPPKLDVAGSLKLSQGQIDQLVKNAPEVSRILGDLGRDQSAQNTLFGLNMLTRPNQTLRASARDEGISAARDKRADALGKLKGRKLSAAEEKRERDRIQKTYNSEVSAAKTAAGKMNPLQDLQKTFSKEFAARDQLLGSLGAAQASTPEYLRMQQAFGEGLGRGELGESLYQTALTRAQSQGQLTPEANRDAVQAARSGMAARGMATGNAGMAAELLNRDRYSRARMAEDLNFASGVQATDQARQQYNIGLLGTSAAAADAERGRQLGLQQDAYNFGLSTNPRMMLAGVGSPYANLQVPGMSQLGGIVGSVQPQYSGGQFSSGGLTGGLVGGAMGAAGGALSGAAMGTMIGPGWGTALGAGLGALGGLTGFTVGSR